RVAKWAIELGDQDIEFRERNNTKKELSKDFLVELPFEEDKKKVAGTTETKLKSKKLSNAWKLYTDGASSSDCSGAGLMLINPEGKEYTYALGFKFKTTNNEAEYEALLAGLQIAKEMEIKSLAIFADSQLMASQIKGAYKAKQPTINEYIKKTKEVLVEVLEKRSIDNKEVLQVEVKEGKSWMTPIHEYLLSGLLSEDLRESRKIRIRAPQYKLIKGSLYKNPSSQHGFAV
ncbi:reverse transcriptase domain-containing protein, partial [Tanacetum coccineum]